MNKKCLYLIFPLLLVGCGENVSSVGEKSIILSDLVRDIWPYFTKGMIKPSIYKVLNITEAEEAHQILLRNENVGKVVLKVC